MTPDPARDAPPSTLPPPIAGPRATARSVKVADAVAGGVVRLGGTLVIVAVVGILVFLVATVVPLFRGATVEATASVGKVPVEGRVLCLAVDEYRFLAAAVGEAPEIVVFRPDDPGRVVARVPIAGLEGARLASARRSIRTKDLAVGTTDGRVALLGLSFAADYVVGEAGDEVRRRLALGQLETTGDAVVKRKAGGTLLRVRCAVEPRGVVALPGGGTVVAVAYATHEDGAVAAAVTADGRAHVLRRAEAEGDAPAAFRVETLAEGGAPVPGGVFSTLVDEELRNAWFVTRDGVLVRVDVRVSPAVVREVRRTDRGDGARTTAAEFVLGDRSLVLADDHGRVAVWSPVPVNARLTAKRADPGDGQVTEPIHELGVLGAPVVSIAACPTRLTYYLGHADGSITSAYLVNDRVLARVQAFAGPVGAIAVGPKDDGLLVAGPGEGYRAFDVAAPHPETNLKALFSPVHYQGYAEPQLRYESSAGSDEAEPKLSLTPLLFGTLKATFYAMLFALPLALLGALYTSQFMHPRVRAVVKPAVEVMASLPSVVLGFVAALVLAPAIEKVVPGVFAAVVSLGVVGFLAGVVWYFLPPELRNGMGSGTRLLLAAALVGGTAWLCVAQTPLIEHLLFQVRAKDGRVLADFRQWMDAPRSPDLGDGSSASGLPLLRVTLAALAATVGMFALPRFVGPRLPATLAPLLRTLVQIGVGAGVPALLAFAAAPLVETVLFGGDFRWFLVGTDDPAHGIVYDQRNSLVVGIAMGFAVIPIIYTIAEDALSAIPDSLRSAALGCGASPWQAATRVVLPAAVPGIFSAAMIGLGRAIGETMIVLMAAGGTAIMDLTIFNGFRTLSVNIATELPEAPVEGTLYRVLFLAGLLLFAITFVLNTVAEVVRLRFRKRFKGL
ncbi:MAG: ABC transporter permease subunit [Planctomycetota bacterium]